MAEQRQPYRSESGHTDTPSEATEPSHSAARVRVPSVTPNAEARRASVRPTAFGPPAKPGSNPPVSRSTPPFIGSAVGSAIGSAVDSGFPDRVRAPSGAPERVRAHTPSPADLAPISRPVPTLHGTDTSALAEEPSRSGARVRIPSQPAPSTAQPATPAPAFKADVEELLPLPDATQSMPRIPLAAILPALGEPAEPPDRGRTLMQVGAFALVLIASVIPALRYTGILGGAPSPHKAVAEAPLAAALPPRALAPTHLELQAQPQTQPTAQAAAEPARPVHVPPKDPVAAEVARIEATLSSNPGTAADELLDAATKALDRGEERLAETLLGHALKRDEKNPGAAFALARIRLAQNNLEGAEGWVLVALAQRPRRADYHALYADILTRQGHASHAHRERRKSKSLEE